MVSAATTAAAGAAAAAAAKNQKPPRDNGAKRKLSMSDMEDDSDSDSDNPSSRKLTGSGKVSASQQLVPVPGQPDAPLVTKRTLQNRKAQREFRKRREARVRELEERCRRFDQMGLEANTELQRLARRLKDENEALKSLIARLGFAHMIPGIMESINNAEHQQQQQHHVQHPYHQHSAPHHPPSFAPMDLGMDAWARANSAMPPQMPPHNTASSQQRNGSPTAAAANKQSNRDRAPTTTATASTSASTSVPPISSLANLPGLTELLPVNAAGGVNPTLLNDASSKPRSSKHSSASSTAAITIPVDPESTTTARPIDDNNSTFDNDWFAQLAQSGHDKDDNQVDAAASADKLASSRNERNDRSAAAANPILSLSFNNNSSANDNKNTKPSSNLSGSAMLGANVRDFGLGLASALGMPASTASGANMFPMPMPTQQNGALLNPNPIPFAFNLSENKMPGEQSWWSQVAGSTLEGDDSILDEKAQAVAQATGASQNGAPSPFDLSAFLNGGLTPGGGGFTFGSQQSNDDDAANDAQKSKANDDTAKPHHGNGGESQPPEMLTQAEHAQMFLRLLEAKMTKGHTSTYAQLGFQPPMHHQQYAAASQAGPSFSDASSSSSSSTSSSKEEDDSSLSPINIYTRLAQHPAFLSTNASELEELVDSIGSSHHHRPTSTTPLFQPPFNNKRNRASTPSKPAPTLYQPTPSGLTPSIYGPNGAASLASRSSSSSSTGGGGARKDLEVDEKAVTKMLGMLDRKTSRDAAAAASGGGGGGGGGGRLAF